MKCTDLATIMTSYALSWLALTRNLQGDSPWDRAADPSGSGYTILVAIPLITMLGLFGYVAYTSVTNWLNLDRAPTLIQETSEPLTNFVNLVQLERRAAVVYLSQPSAANLSGFQSAVSVTTKGEQQVEAALTSPATKSASTPEETAAIGNVLTEVNDMTGLRAQVTAKRLAPLDALQTYTNIIAGQGAVLQAEANSIQDSAPVLQGLGLISAVNTQEDVSEQDAVLASALVSGSLTAEDRVAFSNAVGRLQSDTLSYQQLLTPAELKTYNATMNKLAPADIQQDLTKVQQAVPGGASLSELQQGGLSPATWQLLTSTWLKAASKAGTNTATTVIAANSQPAIDAKRRVVVLAAVGAAGLILTLIVSLLLSRSINRRLTTLRRSALTLAQEQLPSVVARLRRGESVDVAAEAPPLRVGSDEIGQVGQAIDAVRQTAIRSAIDEARVRQGVNDMFRNLARRNQSLLQRQLTVLDEAERRATDPDVLEDLFKMDHLTTRMRRHAEGLIILSGAPPGRSWSAPVKLVDVMRGAVAEVEDYARVTVSTQSRAALAGSAVTDLIHLLAELIENATSLSPPFTQVRVGGETVANGFAIEIEDRGLGMVPQRLQELNERLANPPDLNPANTEQLGLFVVGQLARRHGVRVMLRPSPYGGTTAVVLIPARAHRRGRPRGDHVRRPRARDRRRSQRALQRQRDLQQRRLRQRRRDRNGGRCPCWRQRHGEQARGARLRQRRHAAARGRLPVRWHTRPARPGCRPGRLRRGKPGPGRAGGSASPARCGTRRVLAASAGQAATARAAGPARPPEPRNRAPGADGTVRMTSRS